jgi:hypothetical protein
MSMRFLNLICIGVCWWLCFSTVGNSAERYLVEFTDGTQVTDNHLSGWDSWPGKPMLGDTPLDNKQRPIRWMRDTALTPPSNALLELGYVEFATGDRIPGQVKEYLPANESETKESKPSKPCLLVNCSAIVSEDQAPLIRVLLDNVKRVVWKSNGKRKYSPGTIFYRDGREIRFKALQWKSESLRILTSNGAVQVPFQELAELHLPHKDFWKSYYREIAILSPTLETKLIRLKTVDGLIATASPSRLNAETRIHPDEEDYIESEAERLRQRTQVLAQRQAMILRQKVIVERQIKLQENSYVRQMESAEKAVKAAEKRIIDSEKRLNDRKVHYKKTLEDARRKSKLLIAKKREQVKNLPAADRKRQIDALERDEDRKLKNTERQLELLIQQTERQIKLCKTAKEHALKRVQNANSTHAKNSANRKRSIDRFTERLDDVKEEITEVEKSKKEIFANGFTPVRVDRWVHMIHPTWSLDPLWLRFDHVLTRLHFAPEEVPLSRVAPISSQQKSTFGQQFHWFVDRNANGNLLRNQEQMQGWGIGVHATNELRFPLPESAISFRVRIGLDQSVSHGGCVRASIHLNDPKAKPVFQSDFIVGSQTLIDSGEINLKDQNQAAELILMADSAHEGRPDGADPFDIRDHLNWIAPLLRLDKKQLLSDVQELSTVKE